MENHMTGYLHQTRHFVRGPLLARIAGALAMFVMITAAGLAHANKVCPPGQFQPGLSLGEYEALFAFGGQEAVDAAYAAIPCQACPAGSAAIVVDSPFGQTTLGCFICGPGTIANPHHTQCVACTAGTYSSDGQHCHRCPVGTASAAASGSCSACKAGTAPNLARTACNACKPGHYSADGVSCKACPKGSAVPISGASSCLPCTGGEVSNTGHTACTCALNTIFGPGGCVACPPQQVANNSHTGCTPCKPGSTFQYGVCVKTQANPVGVPGATKKARSPTAPGLLESTPGFGTQAPGAAGTPLRGAGPPGGARGPAGVR